MRPGELRFRKPADFSIIRRPNGTSKISNDPIKFAPPAPMYHTQVDVLHTEMQDVIKRLEAIEETIGLAQENPLELDDDD